MSGSQLFGMINDYYRHHDKKRHGPKVEASLLNIEDWEPIEWFTNTTDYEYINQLLQGLNLNQNFPNAENCILSFVGWIDQFTFVDNNLTKEYYYTDSKD